MIFALRCSRWLALLALVTSLSSGPAAGQQRPNILLFFSDDHAAHAVSAYGGSLPPTPNIDRLAREGMLFEQAFCTNGICAPSRAVILTGQHSHRNGQRTNEGQFDGAQPTMPKMLQAAGYQTALIGKWHLGSTPTGFDHFEILVGQGTYYRSRWLTKEGSERRPGYTTEIITQRTLEWLKSGRDAKKPFLLLCQHKAPHREWAPGPNELGLYRDGDLPEPKDLFDDHGGNRTSALRTQTMSIARHLMPLDLKLTLPTGMDDEQKAAWEQAYGPENAAYLESPPTGAALVRWNYQRYIKDYMRCVAGVDKGVGEVLDHLDRSGLAANTIVLYASDQGFFLGDHGFYDKRWMMEESLQIPLVVRWPGHVTPKSRDRHLVQTLDIAPTFLELAGAPIPATLQGTSLVPLLRGGTGSWRESIYYHYYEYPGVHDVPRHRGVRTARHKLIEYYQRGEWELFDLDLDPDESRNFYDEPSHAEVRAKLTRELSRLRTLYGDTENQ